MPATQTTPMPQSAAPEWPAPAPRRSLAKAMRKRGQACSKPQRPIDALHGVTKPTFGLLCATLQALLRRIGKVGVDHGDTAGWPPAQTAQAGRRVPPCVGAARWCLAARTPRAANEPSRPCSPNASRRRNPCRSVCRPLILTSWRARFSWTMSASAPCQEAATEYPHAGRTTQQASLCACRISGHPTYDHSTVSIQRRWVASHIDRVAPEPPAQAHHAAGSDGAGCLLDRAARGHQRLRARHPAARDSLFRRLSV